MPLTRLGPAGPRHPLPVKREEGQGAAHAGCAVSTSFTQYDVPYGMTSSLKL
jgi:hypothetical protein